MGTGDNTAHNVSTAQGWGVVSFPPEADDKWHAAEATGAMLGAGRMGKGSLLHPWPQPLPAAIC